MIEVKNGPHLGEYKALIKAFYPNDDLEYRLIEDDNSIPKNVVKKQLYDELVKVSGKTLPWGDLTGVRPIRMALSKLYEGLNENELGEYLHSNFGVSSERIKLAKDIALIEKQVIDSLGVYEDGILKKHFCLYVGIPFCPTRCLYCSFTAFPLKLYADSIDRYIECLKSELSLLSDVYRDYVLDAVYIGGGTPSTLSALQLEDLCSFIYKRFLVDKNTEFCVECGRPDSIDIDKLKALKSVGVNRICINPQTLSDKTLKLMGRAHNTKQFYDAYDLATATGFENINTDIILGLPEETIADVENTIKGLVKLNPGSITIHSLALKRAANLKHESEEFRRLHFDMNEAMDLCMRSCKEVGIFPYYLYRQKNMSGNLENTGLSKKGFECIYNMLMIDELCDIAAAGTGTVSRVTLGNGHIERVDCVKDVKLYFERFDETIDKKRRFYEKWRPH